MRGSCSTHGMMRITYRILVREPEGKRPLIRRRHGWEDNIRMDVKEIFCEYGLDSSSSDRTVVNTVMNL